MKESLGQWQGWGHQVLTKFWILEFSGHCYAEDMLEKCYWFVPRPLHAKALLVIKFG